MMKIVRHIPIIQMFLLVLWPASTLAVEAQLQIEPAAAQVFDGVSLLADWELLWWWLPIVILLGLWFLFRFWTRGKGSFQKNALRWNLLFVAGVILVVLVLNAFIYLQEYQRNSLQVQQQLLEQSEKLIKQRVDFIIDVIAEEREHSKLRLEEDLKFRAYFRIGTVHYC